MDLRRSVLQFCLAHRISYCTKSSYSGLYQVLKTCKVGAYKTFLGNLVQRVTVFMQERIFPMQPEPLLFQLLPILPQDFEELGSIF